MGCSGIPSSRSECDGDNDCQEDTGGAAMDLLLLSALVLLLLLNVYVGVAMDGVVVEVGEGNDREAESSSFPRPSAIQWIR